MDLPPAKAPWLRDFLSLSAIWGASFLFMYLGAHAFGALPTAGLRVGIAAVFLVPLLLWRGLGGQLVKHWKKTFLVGLVNSASPFSCFSFALLSISSGLTSVLNATVPLFGALVAWVWIKDRPSRVRILGLMIGFAGVGLLAWDKVSFKPDASGITTGWAVLACLTAALCYGIAASYTKRFLGGVPALVTATGSQLGASIGLLLPTVWLWPKQQPSAIAWMAVLALGVLCSGVAYILFFRLIENVGPARALTVTFMVPVFAVFYGMVFLGEIIAPWTLFCAVIIVCGTALAANLIRLKP
jgi:drug/metabolite transporter (DMT)-like permease